MFSTLEHPTKDYWRSKDRLSDSLTTALGITDSRPKKHLVPHVAIQPPGRKGEALCLTENSFQPLRVELTRQTAQSKDCQTATTQTMLSSTANQLSLPCKRGCIPRSLLGTPSFKSQKAQLITLHHHGMYSVAGLQHIMCMFLCLAVYMSCCLWLACLHVCYHAFVFCQQAKCILVS